jgi:hypothetical protein
MEVPTWGVVIRRRLTMAPTVPKDDANIQKSKSPPAEAQDSFADGQEAGDDDWAMDGAADSDMQDFGK